MRPTQIAAAVAGVMLAFGALAGAALTGGLVGFALGAAGGPAAVGGPPERYLSGRGADKIVVIRVAGPIARDEGGFFFGGASSRHIVRLMDLAQRDDAVKAVILELDTPGGSVVASDEVAGKIAALRESKKPVVALLAEVAASGGYYIASGADRIVADPTTITGSIGVIVAFPDLQEFSRKIGVRTVVFKSGALKDLGNPTRPVTAAEAAIFQGLVDEAHARFVDVVARGRRMERARVARLADGRIYTGRQAHRLGLVDALGHLPEAVAAAMQEAGLKEARVVEYGTGGLLQSLLGSLGGGLRRLRGPADLVQPAGGAFSVQYLMVP